MQAPLFQEPIPYFQKKTQFLRELDQENLLQKILMDIQGILLHEGESRALSPAALRALLIDLSYLLFRHRSWLGAPLLAEVAIDFLNSEYLIPRVLCEHLVEHCLELMLPSFDVDADWDALHYDDEFLEHLFICSILAKSESELAIDLGVGRNMLELLNTAVRMSPEDANDDVFHFAPDLVRRLHEIIQRILAEHHEKPWILSQYQLKNGLQRDPHFSRSMLARPHLDKLLELLLAIGPEGCPRSELSTRLPEHGDLAQLAPLLNAGLVYEVPSSGKGRSPVLCLSRSGIECTSARFAFESLRATSSLPKLSGLSAPYQAALIQAVGGDRPEDFPSWIRSQAQDLCPEALRLAIEFWKKQKNDESLLELFKNLLHNQAHAWIRAEICHALPLASLREACYQLLEVLAETDPSPMVRQAAKAARTRPALRGEESAL